MIDGNPNRQTCPKCGEEVVQMIEAQGPHEPWFHPQPGNGSPFCDGRNPMTEYENNWARLWHQKIKDEMEEKRREATP